MMEYFLIQDYNIQKGSLWMMKVMCIVEQKMEK